MTIVYSTSRVKAMATAHVCIMTKDWERIYITYEELADIAEAVAEHLSAAEGPMRADKYEQLVDWAKEEADDRI